MKKASEKLKERFSALGYLLVFAIFIGLGIAWNIYRWKVFKEVTEADVSFIKWLFLISGR